MRPNTTIVRCTLRVLRVLCGGRRVYRNSEDRKPKHRINAEDERHHVYYMDYVYFNPVKHGYVSVVAHWSHSTSHRRLKARAYMRHWAGEAALFATGLKDCVR